MKKRLVAWSLLLVLAGCDKPILTEAPPRPALVIVVGEISAASTMALVGEVRPRYESSQGFRIDGKIIERKVEVGSLVKKGQRIANPYLTMSNIFF
jgi:multidrug efflux pump subunit AcrA (membrane-fusion protein)